MAGGRTGLHKKKPDEKAKASNDAYTGMLAISLVAMITGCALLYLDWNRYPSKKPATVDTSPPASVARTDAEVKKEEKKDEKKEEEKKEDKKDEKKDGV